MANVIDIKALSKFEQYQLLKDILNYNIELKKEIEKVVPNMEQDISSID